MNSLSMKQLRYFDALARHSHFGRAAEACSISQPALSLQMKELEDHVGAPLIERGARRIRLTPLGEIFAARARDILRAVEELGDLVRAGAAPLTGRLRIGVIPTIAPYLLPSLIPELGRRFPELELRPREAVTHRLIAELGEGRLDAAIVALPMSEPSLAERILFEEEFVLVRPARDAATPPPDLEAMRGARLLLLEEGHCFRDQALAVCKLSAAAARDVMEGSSLATLVQMVGAGLGVTLVPRMAVAVETRAAPVAATVLKRPRPTRVVGMVWRRSTPLADQLERVAACVRETGLALCADPPPAKSRRS